MERLDFVLPDFTRLSWAGSRAREVWEPRLGRIGRAWFNLEWLSVVAGLRACGLKIASPQEFVAQAGEWAKHGLSGLPLEIQGLSTNSYAGASLRAELGKPFAFRIVIAAPADMIAFKNAWDNGDDERIGQLLGYPPCCYRFYRRVWVDEDLVDTTWPMARGSVAAPNSNRCLEVSGPPEANILWRWMGVRATPHLPCSFHCPETVALGQKLIALGRANGYNQEMDWLLEILSWPVEWSALHGIAEIKTPVLKVSARTDATPTKYVVRRIGTAYPDEGAQGLGFPYRVPAGQILTQSAGFRRGLDNPIKPRPPEPAWYAADNGFNSRLAMEQAHRPVIELATATLAGQSGNILDLGCGNGALLRQICQVNPGLAPFGLEFDPGRVEHARELQPDYAENFSQGDIFASEWPWPDGRRYALAILMPGRLLETGSGRAARLKARLAQHCDHLLVYAYGDWLTRYGDLPGLAGQAGLKLLKTNAPATAGLAMVE
ncbi:MAG: methyltransferase domain-containing protein [Anaerolineae bacterium]|nr:methyltransferase domain-containing protein [Anaerolineae bacterium]